MRKQSNLISKHQILDWLNSTLHSNENKIQSLGNGISYCLLINHFHPQTIPKNKIIMLPRSSMDNKANLRKFQESLVTLNIKNITFDIFRVSENSYLENWQLINKLFKHFQQFKKINQVQIENRIQPQPLREKNQQNESNVPVKDSIKSSQINTGLLTPMKGLKFLQQNARLRCYSMKLMETIKQIVKSQKQSDKMKVQTLKKMLGLLNEQDQQDDLDMGQLFSDCKKKQQVITID